MPALTLIEARGADRGKKNQYTSFLNSPLAKMSFLEELRRVKPEWIWGWKEKSSRKFRML